MLLPVLEFGQDIWVSIPASANSSVFYVSLSILTMYLYTLFSDIATLNKQKDFATREYILRV